LENENLIISQKGVESKDKVDRRRCLIELTQQGRLIASWLIVEFVDVTMGLLLFSCACYSTSIILIFQVKEAGVSQEVGSIGILFYEMFDISKEKRHHSVIKLDTLLKYSINTIHYKTIPVKDDISDCYDGDGDIFCPNCMNYY